MGLRLILLDYSGTISDDGMPVYHTNNIQLSNRGHPPLSFEQWRQESSYSPASFLQSQGVNESSDRLNNEFAFIYDKIKELIHPQMFDGVSFALESFQKANIKLAIISTTPEDAIRAEMKAYKIDHYITEIRARNGRSVDKRAEIFASLKINKVSDLETVYIGDTIFDMRVAREAGVRTAAAGWGYHSPERLAAEQPTEGVHNSWQELVDKLIA